MTGLSQETLFVLSGIVVIICVVLALYIKRKYILLDSVKKQQQEEERKTKQRYEEQRSYLIESITVISKAYGNDDKLSCTEACMRLSTLLEALAPQLLESPEVSVIREVHKRTEHIPIKEEWKALSKQQKWKFSKEMAKLDSEYKAKVLDATRYLIAYDFKMLTH